ncbi:MAG: ABC transporter ATP-binding protein [Theionarchaea archaeon]|nr:ABC transporter ATP-binding protein [Theionarchaea archaeon]
MLTITNLVTGYGKIEILHGVNMLINDHQMTVVIGPNGAGKSTIFRAIFGIIKVWDGTISFNGADISKLDTQALLRKGISYVPQGRNIFPLMTIEENLEMGAYIRRDETQVKEDIEQIYKRFPILGERREEEARNLSGGQQQMLEMGRSLLLDPEFIMLDEPSLGLAPNVADKIFKEIIRIKESGKTIMMVEQNAKRALELADYAYVLELGKNKYEGPARDIMENEKVKKLYLGG